MAVENSSKKLLKQYGIFAGILLGMFALLILVIFFSENARRTGLKNKIEQVLEEEEPATWSVGDYVEIKAPVALSAACFQARKKDTGTKGYVLMLRIETLYGPFPAVFVYEDKKSAKFVGIYGLNGRIHDIIGNGKNDARINFWITRIPDIVSKTVE
jgi:hypothetical protein